MSVIYGLIPVGGKALRLGIPFAKEMLPLKGLDHYRPLISHIVDKMRAAGVERIVFVHGREHKEDIRRFYPDCQHLNQGREGFARVLEDCWKAGVDDEDTVLFGLPDTLFDGNPFPEMLTKPGIVCGMFVTSPDSKVDRLADRTTFDVKAVKTLMNSDLFWGVLKFEGRDLRRIVESGALEETNEIGKILNMNEFSLVLADQYRDLGTWAALNRYWSET